MARFLLLAFVTSAYALTITSPATSSMDPTKPLTITWTSSPDDPSTFDLVLKQSNSLMSVYGDITLASNVATSAGSYTVPANTAQVYGDQFVIEALSNGAMLSQTSALGVAAAAPEPGTTSAGVGASVVTSGTEAKTSTSAKETATGAKSADVTTSASMTSSMATSPVSSRTSIIGSASATSTTNAQARLKATNSKVLMAMAGTFAGLTALYF